MSVSASVRGRAHKLVPAAVMAVLLASGCAGPRCDQPEPYQQVRARPALEVPEDLGRPPSRGGAPEMAGTAARTRSDGRCLEQPPVYVPETGPGDDD